MTQAQKAYVVSLDEKHVICSVETGLKSGTIVNYSWKRCKNALNPSIGYNLVNAGEGKISRAKKWEKKWMHGAQERGDEIYDYNFYIS